MRQTGRPRAPKEARDRRNRLVAAALLLLALGAGILVSAGSAHHQPGTAAMTSATVVNNDNAAMTNPLSAHEHHHGNEWAPTLSKRLRPAATVAFLVVAPPRPVALGACGDESPSTAPAPTADGLALLGVLRV